MGGWVSNIGTNFHVWKHPLAFAGLYMVLRLPEKAPDKDFLQHLQNLHVEFFCKCFSISKPENAKSFTKSVNAVRFL
jgi:hypothetical protein